jgi:hypothetical protein
VKFNPGPGEYVYVPTSMIREASYNPPKRSDPNEAKIKNLAKSINDDGQRVPVILYWGDKNKTFLNMSEGHGRLAACKMLGKPVLSIIYPYAEDGLRAKDWQVVNDNVQKINGNGRLIAWLLEPMTATHYMQTAFQKMENEIGRDLVQKIATSGKGWDLYKSYALPIARYCRVSRYSKAKLRQIVEWLLDVKGSQSSSRKWMKESESSLVLMNCITSMEMLSYNQAAA